MRIDMKHQSKTYNVTNNEHMAEIQNLDMLTRMVTQARQEKTDKFYKAIYIGIAGLFFIIPLLWLPKAISNYKIAKENLNMLEIKINKFN